MKNYTKPSLKSNDLLISERDVSEIIFNTFMLKGNCSFRASIFTLGLVYVP